MLLRLLRRRRHLWMLWMLGPLLLLLRMMWMLLLRPLLLLLHLLALLLLVLVLWLIRLLARALQWQRQVLANAKDPRAEMGEAEGESGHSGRAGSSRHWGVTGAGQRAQDDAKLGVRGAFLDEVARKSGRDADHPAMARQDTELRPELVLSSSISTLSEEDAKDSAHVLLLLVLLKLLKV